MINRYWLFTGDNYYPEGGMHDFRGKFETMLDAIVNIGRADWVHVLDTKTGYVYNEYQFKHKSGPELIDWANSIDNGADNS